MRRLRSFLVLRVSDQCLLVEAVVILGLVRLGLRVLSFRLLWRLLDRPIRSAFWAPPGDSAVADRITWAVGVASPYVLGVRPCLAQALAARFLLGRRGLPALLRVGVTRAGSGRVQAHAWMETDGRVVTGGSPSEVARYTPLLALGTRGR
jgi:hypothetical protein